MTDLFGTGIRPAIDDYLQKKSEEKRDYGAYWSASSAGYCMRKLIFERLGVPPVEKDSDSRRQRVFEAGHIFHEWAQRITKAAGLSIAQELEVQDEELMVRGHIDDLIEVNGHLILYDYKTQHSRAFDWQKGRPISYYHKMQTATYMYILRKKENIYGKAELSEARVLKISKDDLRMDENQLLWSDDLEFDVKTYWDAINDYWKAKKMPPCTCADHENGFMAKQQFNPYFYDSEPCSLAYYAKLKAEGKLKISEEVVE